MIVTSKKGKADKIHIYIDGEYRCTVLNSFWYGSGILDGDTIDEDRLASLIREAGFSSAYQNGIRLLSKREHGKQELYMKLIRKHDADSVKRATDKLEKQGLIDDLAYAKRLFEYLYNTKKWDGRRIRLEFKAKGISAEITETIINEGIDKDPTSRIIMLLNTKFSGSFSDEKGKRRVFSSLLRMGYQHADIRSAFSQTNGNCETDYGEDS